MKRMYTFTLNDVKVATDSTKSDLRLMAYLIYDEIRNREETPTLVSNDILKYNQLYERLIEEKEYVYHFESDSSGTDNWWFEPCVLDDRSFGITLYDGIISEEMICEIVKSVLKFMNGHYSLSISSVTYEAKNVRDEGNRFKAIKKAIMGDVQPKVLAKKPLIKPFWKPSVQMTGR